MSMAEGYRIAFRTIRNDSKGSQDDQLFRTLIAGAKASLSRNACFKSDLDWAIRWLTEAKEILDRAESLESV